jgi:hypothetical protein
MKAPAYRRFPVWLASAVTLVAAALPLAPIGCSRTPLLDGIQNASDSGGRGGAPVGGAGGTRTASSGGATRLGSGGMAADVAPPVDLAPDVSPAVAEYEACAHAIIAQCERLYVCQGFDVGGCARFAADHCPEYYFGPHTLRTAENVEACAELIASASCTDFEMGTATQCMLAGIGAAGAPCSGPSECASNLCTGYFPICGTCAQPLGLGESCAGSNGHCASGSICHPTSRLCVATPLVVAHAAAGQACDLHGNPPVGCTGDLVCALGARTGTAGTCVPLPRNGQPCLANGDPIPCAAGLQCGPVTADGGLVMTCSELAPCGTTFCQSTSFCYQTSAGPVGCRTYAGVGEACSNAAASERKCAPDARCARTSDAAVARDGGIIYDGTCVARVQVDLGGACDANAPCRSPLVCQSGRCARFDPATCYQAKDGGS